MNSSSHESASAKAAPGPVTPIFSNTESKSAGRAIARKEPTASAPMAAISLKFEAALFHPSWYGLTSESRKWLPSTSISVLTTVSHEESWGITAQSSPMPRTPS